MINYCIPCLDIPYFYLFRGVASSPLSHELYIHKDSGIPNRWWLFFDERVRYQKISFPLYISFVMSHFMDRDLLISLFMFSVIIISLLILHITLPFYCCLLFSGFEDPCCLSQLAGLLGLSWGIIEWAWLGVRSWELELTALVGVRSLCFVLLFQYALFTCIWYRIYADRYFWGWQGNIYTYSMAELWLMAILLYTNWHSGLYR